MTTQESFFRLPEIKKDKNLRQYGNYNENACTYIAMLHSPRRSFWKPLIAITVAGLVYLMWACLCMGIASLSDAFLHTTIFNTLDHLDANNEISNTGVMVLNLCLIIGIIPASLFSYKLVFRVKMGTIFSVKLKIRKLWLAYLFAIILFFPLLALINPSELLGENLHLNFKTESLIKIILILILVPLQSASEEIFFRGWFIQTFGSWFKNSFWAWLVIGTISALIFVQMHGASSDIVNTWLALFAILCTILTRITGGIEAGIVIHACNNTFLFLISELSQDQVIISPRAHEIDDSILDSGIILFSILLFLVAGSFYLAKRWGYLQNIFIPLPIPPQIMQDYQYVKDEKNAQFIAESSTQTQETR